MRPRDYVTRVLWSPAEIAAAVWDKLVDRQSDPSPFVRHAYLTALHESGCAVAATGWQPCYLTLWVGDELVAACPLYLKAHSQGEYVFDWAWADAHARHGLSYYPKALIAVPFTPVPGARLLAQDDAARGALVQALLNFAKHEGLSSLHLLFAQAQDVAACAAAGMMLRHTVQFHWINNPPPSHIQQPESVAAIPSAEPSNRRFASFDDFLASLQQEKRKKIRQERRKVEAAGVTFRHAQGRAITDADWDFFYRCYERTYLEHGNPPYLNPAFFHRMAQDMPEHWVMFIGERDGLPIASSLIGLDGERGVAYGRYWGAMERVDCLHFEACYYQPIEWCIAQGIGRFEGGAQGEHKMARALLPIQATSAHWLAHPAFADAVQRFLDHESPQVVRYLTHLEARSPLKNPSGPPANAIADNPPD